MLRVRFVSSSSSLLQVDLPALAMVYARLGRAHCELKQWEKAIVAYDRPP